MIKRMGEEYEKKYQEKAVVEASYQEDGTRGEVSYFCLDYAILRLALLADSSENKELSTKATKAVRTLVSKYPKLRLETDPSNIT